MDAKFDLIVIGLGPAGMAVSIMGSAMGLNVCAIEKNKIGGECMNVGCIPSKSLLRMAKYRNMFEKLDIMELAKQAKPEVVEPFKKIAGYIDYIRDKKTMGMFEKVHLVYQKGAASFVDSNTVEVAGERYSAKRIFICTGTKPQVPDFKGLTEVGYLTNENIFSLDSVPQSLLVVGGGAIACEMAQAFCRLGSKVTMIIRGPRLMWREDQDATDMLEETLQKEGVSILKDQKPVRFDKKDGKILMTSDTGDQIEVEKVLVGAGRVYDYSSLGLERAGVEVDSHGAIKVDNYLQTSNKNIYGVGDCNGHYLFSHAAMHQGMIALMNSMSPPGFKKDFRKYQVPWTVFTEPQISQVGMKESQLKEKGLKYEVIKVDYSDYGAAIAEAVDVGFIKAFVSPMGRIYGVYIVGEGSGEMINEWGLAIQNKLRIHNIMMLQHSFPTMSFLTKRVGESWMMNKMKSPMLKKICRFMFRCNF